MAQNFDISNPLWVTPDYAEATIQNAWIGQCMSDGWISSLIRYGTQGVHSHSEMFRRNGGDQLDILELREFKGGRRKTFQYHMKQTGRIDVFAPDMKRWPEFDPLGAVNAMRRLTDYEYGWFGIWRMAARRIPVLWRLYPPTTDDRLPKGGKPIRQPFCSHAVSLATHLGGGVDPVPRCPHYLVTPSALTYSLFYEYKFTIASPDCVKQLGDAILETARHNEAALGTEGMTPISPGDLER